MQRKHVQAKLDFSSSRGLETVTALLMAGCVLLALWIGFPGGGYTMAPSLAAILAILAAWLGLMRLTAMLSVITLMGAFHEVVVALLLADPTWPVHVLEVMAAALTGVALIILILGNGRALELRQGIAMVVAGLGLVGLLLPPPSGGGVMTRYGFFGGDAWAAAYALGGMLLCLTPPRT